MSGGESPTQTNEVSVPKEFQPFLFGDQGVVQRGQELQIRNELSPNTIFGDTTQQAQQALTGVAEGAQQVLSPVQQNFLDLMNFDSLTDPRTEAVAAAATRPIREQLNEVALPTLGSQAIDVGQFGGSRQGVAEAVLRDRAARTEGDIRSNIFFNALQQDLARKERSGNMAGQLLGLQQIPGQILANVGAQQDIPLNEQENAIQRNLFDYARLIQGFIPGASQTVTQDGGGLSKGQRVGGGALAGAGIGAQAGTVFGMPGMAVGAGLGALGGLLL